MIRIGIVGIGAIAEEYISIFSESAIQGAKITALASRNEDRVQNLIDQYGLKEVHYYSNLELMLKDDQIDAVMMTTPNSLHHDMAKLVIKHGKHGLVDKPLGVTTLEVDELVALSKEHPELTLAVMFNCRSNPIFKKVKTMVDTGEMGELRRANWQVTDYYRPATYYGHSAGRGTYRVDGGGVLINQAIHHLDLLLWFTGMPTSLMAFMKEGFHRPMATETDVNLNFFYENGATGQFLTSTHESPGTNRLELSFSKGQIIIEDDFNLKITRLNVDENDYSKEAEDFFVHIPSEVTKETFRDLTNKDEHTLTIQNFIHAIEGKEDVICNFESGAKTIRMVNASYLSHWINETISLDFEGETYQKALEQVIQKEETAQEKI